ncbi:glycosyltransferase family 4 protein [Faecalibacter sp. WQ 117]|uniref:Glycosyltransferase family 4 protein n=2 Tax=Faecalibacter rhinopitheci TaxID=2779678 RepID=A0A8J7GA33_9FLAO|nr:glycosyltransferase family 4 protein [Faecalibacter rhinopitheci]
MSSKGFEVIGVSSAGAELDEVHKTEGIRIVPIEMSRKITPIADIKSLWQTYQFFKKEKPQIVHTHTPKAGIVGMLAAKLAGVPIRLHTVAGLPLMEASGNKRKVLDFVEKLTYNCATRVYPNSKGLYDFILTHQYTSEDKLKVIGNGSSNGIDTSFFSKDKISIDVQQNLKKELKITPSDFVFIFVGRLVGDKGINELVKAFKGLGSRDLGSGIWEQEVGSREQGAGSREQGAGNRDQGVGIWKQGSGNEDWKENNSSAKLLLVGPLESDLDPLQPETLEEINSNPNIISVGFQKDVRPYFAVSDALVFPSYREGFPNVVMQAGAMGLPSIVSNINGCNEIIVEGQNGTIIPVKDAEAIYKAMEKMMNDQSYYTSLQVNSRPMIQSRYEQSLVWNALLEEYDRLVAGTLGIRD